MFREYIDYFFGVVKLNRGKGNVKLWETNIFKSKWLNNKISLTLSVNGTLSIEVDRHKNIYIFTERQVTDFEFDPDIKDRIIYYKWGKKYVVQVNGENDDSTCEFIGKISKGIIIIDSFEERKKYGPNNINWIYVKK